MKSLLVGIFYLIGAAAAFCQGYPFIDAKSLATGTQDSQVAVLRQYFPGANKTTDANDVLQRFENFPLIGKLLEQGKSRSGPRFPGNAPSANAGSGISATTVAEGLAQFLIKRAKEEVALDFLDRLNASVDQYPELQILFPQSVGAFRTALANANNGLTYDLFVSGTTSSFRRDVGDLPGNLLNLDKRDVGSKDSADEAAFQERQRYYAAFLSSAGGLSFRTLARFSSGLVQGDSLQTITANLERDLDSVPPGDKSAVDLTVTLRLFMILADSFRTDDINHPWVTVDDIKGLSQDEMSAYVGLIFARIDEDILTPYFPDDRPKYLDLLGQVESSADGVQKALASLTTVATSLEKLESLNQQTQVSGLSPDQTLLAITAYLASLADLFDAASGFGWLSQDVTAFLTVQVDPKLLSTAKTVSREIRAGIQIATYLSKSDYSSAFASAASAASDMLESLKGIDLGATHGAPVTLSADQLQSIADLERKLALYGGFVAAVADVKSADDVEAVIAQYAAPPTSYRARFTESGSFKVGAYLAYTYGYNGSAGENGGYAPIGIGLGKGNSSSLVDNVTLFVGVLDVGALVTYGLSDSSSAAPELTWRDLIAPSLNVILGLGRSPLVLGVGVRYAPWITQGGMVEGIVFVGVDIPLLLL